MSKEVTQASLLYQVRSMYPDGVPAPGEGYDMATLKRFALMQNKMVEVVNISIKNKRGEQGSVMIPLENVTEAVKVLMRPENGVVWLNIQTEW